MFEQDLVIDVDSHWELPKDPSTPQGDPSERVKGFVAVLAGDVLVNVPPEEWPPIEAMTSPELIEFFSSPGASPMSQGLGASDVPGRIEWCDQVGIDFQFVNGGGFTGLELGLADVDARRAAIRWANDVLLDELDAHQDRFSTIAICDASDLDVSIPELERCRARGSRAFHIRAEPPNGMSFAHPHFDRLWSAAVDLGMVPYLHIGNTPAHFDAGWANVGIGEEGSVGAAALTRISNSARTQSAEIMLASMAFGGVFARNPALTLFVAELWSGWLPFLVMRLNQNTEPGRKAQSDLFLGKWPYDIGAGDFLRDHVRVSPLPGLGPDGIPTLLEEPEMVVFSSDYPHLEGSPTPIDAYGQELRDLDADTRASFMGGNVLDVFERMGDPLPVKKPAGV